MSNLILDSSAWIEYYGATERGKKIRDELHKKGIKIYVTGLIVAEIGSKALKERRSLQEALAPLQNLCSIIPFDFELARITAELYVATRKTNSKFGIVDAHVLAAAQVIHGKLITCDNDFVGMPNTIIIR